MTTTMKLRPYQEEWVADVNARLRAVPRARVIGQMPTGGGKTFSACEIIRGWQSDHPDCRVFWVTHRKELIDQSAAVLTAHGVPAYAARADVWKPGMALPLTGDVIVTSPITLRKRDGLAQTDAGDLLVLDEAHHSAARTWTALLEQHQGAALGLTATPWRLSVKEGFDHLYRELVQGPQTADLIRDGSLASYRLFGPPLGGRIVGTDADRDTTGEFSESSVYERHSRTVLLDNAYDIWQRYGGGTRQTLIYALTVPHGRNIVDLWAERGCAAAMLHSKTPASERDEIMRRYRDGSLQTLVNVEIATEGFDIPAIGCVLILRPTASLALYLQMLGRGLRPNPNGQPALLLDLTDNPHRLGRPDEIRRWSLAARKGRDSDDKAEAPTKTCWSPTADDEHCGAINAAGAHVCEVCGAAFGRECPICGRFRSWEDWPERTDRCGPCVDGQRHDHLSYIDSWRISRKGNHYRVLDSKRVMVLVGDAVRGVAALLYVSDKFSGRHELPWLSRLDKDDADEQWWRARQIAEQWQGIHDRPDTAKQLLKRAFGEYKNGRHETALTLLHEAKAARGAPQVGQRIAQAERRVKEAADA